MREQLAMLCAILTNVHRDPKSPPVSHQDFLFRDRSGDEAKQTGRMRDILRAIATPMKRRKRKKRRARND